MREEEMVENRVWVGIAIAVAVLAIVYFAWPTKVAEVKPPVTTEQPKTTTP
jgi:hypothetical protein